MVHQGGFSHSQLRTGGPHHRGGGAIQRTTAIQARFLTYTVQPCSLSTRGYQKRKQQTRSRTLRAGGRLRSWDQGRGPCLAHALVVHAVEVALLAEAVPRGSGFARHRLDAVQLLAQLLGQQTRAQPRHAKRAA